MAFSSTALTDIRRPHRHVEENRKRRRRGAFFMDESAVFSERSDVCNECKRIAEKLRRRRRRERKDDLNGIPESLDAILLGIVDDEDAFGDYCLPWKKSERQGVTAVCVEKRWQSGVEDGPKRNLCKKKNQKNNGKVLSKKDGLQLMCDREAVSLYENGVSKRRFCWENGKRRVMV